LFGIKQETIDWDKTAKSDFEGSINIEMHSNSLDSRFLKNTLVCESIKDLKVSYVFLYLYKYCFVDSSNKCRMEG